MNELTEDQNEKALKRYLYCQEYLKKNRSLILKKRSVKTYMKYFVIIKK